MWKITKKVMTLLDKKEIRKLRIIIAMMFLGAILESLGVSLILPLITAITDEEAVHSGLCGAVCGFLHIRSASTLIKLLIIALILIYIFKNAYLMVQNYVQFRYTSDMRKKIQKKLLHYYMQVPYAFYLSADSGTIIRNLTIDVDNFVGLMNDLLLFYTEGIVAVIMAAAVFCISPQIMLYMAFVFILEYLVLIRLLRSYMKRYGVINKKERAGVHRLITQIIGGIKSIKTSRTEEFFENSFDAHASRQIESERMAKTLNAVPKLIIEAVTVAFMMLYLLIMLLLGKNLEAIIPVLSAFVVAAVRLLPCVNRISTSTSSASFNEVFLDTILEKLEASEKISADVPEARSEEKWTFEKEIEFRNITFRYPDQKEPVLNRAGLVIRKGCSVGLIGESGAGKTTTVDILLGLLSPQKGEVLVDSRNINTGLNAWHELVAYIPQDIFILNDTVRANVAFGVDEKQIDDEKVWKALEEAQLADFVRKLPEGLNTVLGEKGIRFSGGQKQRVGIARALYHDPTVIIFDEATSSLDNETEQSVIESIGCLKGRKTMITIAHRLSTIENCDEVYKVENGKITRE